MDSEKIKYGEWYWSHGRNRPVFALYPYGEKTVVCILPDMRPGHAPGMIVDYIEIDNLAEINPTPNELDY